MCSPKFLMKTFVETAAHPFRYLSFRQWCTADEKMKVPSAENPQLSEVFCLKAKVGQLGAVHATLLP